MNYLLSIVYYVYDLISKHLKQTFGKSDMNLVHQIYSWFEVFIKHHEISPILYFFEKSYMKSSPSNMLSFIKNHMKKG